MGITYNNIPAISGVRTHTYLVGNYIPTPVATPLNFGDPLEGGYYTGMIWNQLVQTNTSSAIATGVKTFTVPDMVSKPIVYEGQLLEVRSRSNPNNKMTGVVTGAKNTILTMNITSVSGSGTFSDWSVMSRYRIIVSPKAAGENAGIRLKNTNTALTNDCRTFSEGYSATESMRLADTSTVYPAAHWARSLNINGYTDWYIPARDELELCWRNLKPVTSNNYAGSVRTTASVINYVGSGSYGDTSPTNGTNNNSSPVGAAYTDTIPVQTNALAFRTGGSEAFLFTSVYYWTSSDYSAGNAWMQYWHTGYPGYQGTDSKANLNRVRVVRRSVV